MRLNFMHVMGILIPLPVFSLAIQNHKKPIIQPSSKIPERREFPLNQEISPCEDFHQHVCSMAEKSFQLRPDRSRHDFAFDDSNERILEYKKKFLKNIDQEKDLGNRAVQFKKFYSACMSQKAKAKDEKKYVQLLMQEMEKIKDSNDFTQYDLRKLQNGESAFLAFDKNPNVDNSDVYDAYFGFKIMNLPDHAYYENKELVQDYKEILKLFFQTLYPKMDMKTVSEKVEKIYQVELAFVSQYPKAEVRRRRWSEKWDMTQDQFLTKYPQLQMKSFFDLLPKSTIVQIKIPEAFEFYNNELSVKSLNSFKDIYLYKTLASIMDDAYPAFFKKRFDFNKKYFGGPEQRPSREERCTYSIMNNFEKELDEVLMDRLFPHFPKEKIEDLSLKIKSSIVSGINANSWLSSEAKTMARKKIETCQLQIVKPRTEREWDFNPIKEYSSTEAIGNQYKLNKALLDKTMTEIGQPVNKEAWSMGPLTVNAYYSSSENKFVMPMGILQYPFFDETGELVENLGAVGAVLGHELGHSIDDGGSQFDETGRIKNWMTPNDLSEFKKRGIKMVGQFNKIGHNGELTLGENIADLVGLSFAYNAAFPKNEGQLKAKQKFFVSYARNWCQVTRPGAAERQLKTDPHSLGWARINEQVKHQKGFQEAFNCPAGSKMTLENSERISIW